MSNNSDDDEIAEIAAYSQKWRGQKWRGEHHDPFGHLPSANIPTAPLEPSSDPLRETFDQFEREVRARKLREIQARCPHDRTTSAQAIGLPDQQICLDCGLYLPLTR